MSSDLEMDRHIETINAMSPEDKRKYHHLAHDALGLRGAAKEQVIKERNAAAVAHLLRNSDVRASLSKMDDSSQLEELKRIRTGENSGPEPDPDSPEGVDSYLKLAGHFEGGR